MSNSVTLTNNALVEAGYPQYCAPSSQDVSSLASIGSDFCTSYISYTPPTSTSVVLSTPPATTSVVLSVQYSTVVSDNVVTVTAPAQKMKRDDDGSHLMRVSIDAYTTSVINPVSTSVVKRAAVATPDLVAHWPAQKISAACSLVATGTALTTVTSVAATPVVTATSISTSTTTSISTSTTTTTAAKVYPTSGYFYVTDSAGNFILDSYSGGVDSLIPSLRHADVLALDSGSFVHAIDANNGAPLFMSVQSITGNDQLFYDPNAADTNKIFCSLQNLAAASGSLTCSVGGPGGQENIFQLCNGNYYIGTSVASGCQQVTLTAIAVSD